MVRSSMRLLTGGALMLAILSGCASRSPFTDTFDAERPRHPQAARAEVSTPSRSRGNESAPLPVLDADARLEEYLRYAALENPGLEAMFREWKAAVERLPQVRALPDPRFTYGYYLGEVETRVGPMQHSLALSQTFPWFGTLQDREDAAARHANAAFERFEAARLALFLRVERAYNELFFLKRSIDITGDNIELLQQFERVARTRYRVAAVGHPDIIKIQVELGTLEDRLRQLQDLRDSHTARLNAALNRPSDAPIPWPTAISEREVSIDDETLLAVLSERNPDLLALQEEIERERINAEIARKDGYPDFTVGLAYTVIGERNDVSLDENGDDALLGTLSVNLPIWREKYDAGVREAIARRLAAAGRREEAYNRLASELQEAIFEHEDARRRVTLYRDTLIPKARESLQASLGSFQQGQSDYLDLVDTQRTLLEFRLAIERALVDRATSAARIEQLVGMPPTELDDTSRTEGETP
ncbi:MAG: TolC family protein [Planctomycetota bacterium]|nr:TolC family protein [Planctomycetota bacterium]